MLFSDHRVKIPAFLEIRYLSILNRQRRKEMYPMTGVHSATVKSIDPDAGRRS
jgi:hypothetical protein